jgi:hypothetical protein
MSNMSIQVQNRKNTARFAVSSVKTHREEVVQGLLARNAELPVTQQIDEGTIRLVLDWLAAAIGHEAMVAAEMAYAAEQLEDPMVRARRDEVVSPVLAGLTRVRMRISLVWGDDGLTLYGLNKPVPRLPQEVADYAGMVVDLLRKTPSSVSDGVRGVVDTAILADALEGVLRPLAQRVRPIKRRAAGVEPTPSEDEPK